ncbi:hypothetical protein [Roseibium sp.]|uniref:hypothetical protein n=1 Tax=Roseibium sp. TaxID=1936156 RepID=UPI003B52F38F
MTKDTQIKQLKLLAKRYAHACRLPKYEALNAVAAQLEFPSWTSLATKAKNGWTPSNDDLATAKAFVRRSHPSLDQEEMFIEKMMTRPADEPIRHGKIGDHEYHVFESLGDIRLEGTGWSILMGEADLSQPIVEIEATHSKDNPANGREFIDAALAIADEEVAKVRAGIASDWPRRSTMPDAEGTVEHPLTGDRSKVWFCLHCDGEITGAQVAGNLWHCPGCGASPTDIFASPWWLEGSSEEPHLVDCSAVKQRPEPKVEVVDSRPTLKLDEESISLLLRTALLEDATNPGERFGALLAEINVDDENDAWITLDEDLWPEDKEPEEAIAVADKLGVELELAVTCMTFPFAWPALGHVTGSSREYVQLLLDAYTKHGVVYRGRDGD